MSPRPPIGSFAWCEEYGATLNRREKFEIVTNVARLQVREQFERSIFGRSSMHAIQAKCDLHALAIPDSRIAKDAAEHAQTLCPPNLYLHCIRTYFYGGLLAQGQGLKVDLELLFVGSILHDLGISPTFIEEASHLCFATTGAREAARFVVARGWDETRVRRLYESISLHFNARIDHRVHGTEARFLGEGAQIDVLGMRFQRVPRSAVRVIEEQYPRKDFEQECIDSNARANHPRDSRPGFGGPSGFNALVRRNPLNRAARIVASA